MKYRSYILFLNTILTYRNLIFHVQNIGISYRNGMLKRYLRTVCKIGISYCFRYEILIQNAQSTGNWNLNKKFKKLINREVEGKILRWVVNRFNRHVCKEYTWIDFPRDYTVFYSIWSHGWVKWIRTCYAKNI